MLLWWKEYFHDWKMNLFFILQIVFVLFLVNIQVSFLAEEYNKLNFATETESGMYFYQNAMGVLTDAIGYDGFVHAKEKLNQLDGFEGIAYQAYMFCELDNYKNDVTLDRTVENINLSPLLWRGLAYRLESGRWFQEKDAKEDILQVIIGGGLSKKYKIGDTLTLNYQGETKKKAVVIGSLGTKFYMLQESFNIEGIYLSRYAGEYTENNDIILSNNENWFEDFHDTAVYPTMSTMVKVNKDADLSEYKKYGVLSSFDEVMHNTRERCKNFIWNSICDNGLWILVILFGVIGTSYLTSMKRRYLWGIYSLLGATGNRLLVRLLLQNALTYFIGGIASILLFPYIANFLNYTTKFTMINIIATVLLIGILFLISYLCNQYIKFIEPKEILNQTKG